MTLVTFLILILFFVFLIGLCIGSFLNVVILRAFSNESIAYPGSKCPSCQTPLKWYHNIPVLSYLFLKGKCSFCKEKISAQYPVVELLTGLLFVGVFIKFGIDFNALFMWVFVALFVVLATTDIKEKVIFDFHAYILIIAGLLYNVLNLGHLYSGQIPVVIGHFAFGINNSIVASLLGILLGILIMEAFARFGYLVAGTRAFGEGDTYIAAGLGSIFGWKYLLTILAYAFILQIVLTVPVFVKKLYAKKDYRTLSSFFVFFILVLIMKWLDYSDIYTNVIVFGLLTLLLCVVGFYVCKRILGGLKDKENMTYLPFGPAMVAGGLIVMFMLPQLPL